jgi:hypothetical protein
MTKLKLSQVAQITGRTMTASQAVGYVSIGPFLRNQAAALQMMTRLNTREDWLRLQAAMVCLRNMPAARKASQDQHNARMARPGRIAA